MTKDENEDHRPLGNDQSEASVLKLRNYEPITSLSFAGVNYSLRISMTKKPDAILKVIVAGRLVNRVRFFFHFRFHTLKSRECSLL